MPEAITAFDGARHAAPAGRSGQGGQDGFEALLASVLSSAPAAEPSPTKHDPIKAPRKEASTDRVRKTSGQQEVVRNKDRAAADEPERRKADGPADGAEDVDAVAAARTEQAKAEPGDDDAVRADSNGSGKADKHPAHAEPAASAPPASEEATKAAVAPAEGTDASAGAGDEGIKADGESAARETQSLTAAPAVPAARPQASVPDAEPAPSRVAPEGQGEAPQRGTASVSGKEPAAGGNEPMLRPAGPEEAAAPDAAGKADPETASARTAASRDGIVTSSAAYASDTTGRLAPSPVPVETQSTIAIDAAASGQGANLHSQPGSGATQGAVQQSAVVAQTVVQQASNSLPASVSRTPERQVADAGEAEGAVRDATEKAETRPVDVGSFFRAPAQEQTPPAVKGEAKPGGMTTGGSSGAAHTDGNGAEAAVEADADIRFGVTAAGGYGRPLGRTAAPSPQPAALAGSLQSAPEAADQVAQRIARAASGGSSQIRIDLVPESLGRVEVRIEIRDGATTATLVAERRETLELLRADAPKLERALTEAGVKLSADGVQFVSAKDDTQGQGRGEPQSRDAMAQHGDRGGDGAREGRNGASGTTRQSDQRLQERTVPAWSQPSAGRAAVTARDAGIDIRV
jgi:flagellar hook-length control protein FliK